MASINLVKLTDTFNTFMDLVNSIINKINKIEVDDSSAKINFTTATTGPVADADIATSQAVLFFDSSGNLKIRRRLSDGTYDTKTVTIT